MATCKQKVILYTLILIFINSASYADLNFKKLDNKKVSFLDFFLLKFENSLTRKSQALRREIFATRVQYSNIGIKAELDNKREKIFIDIYAIMDKRRYSKKRYKQKLSDCNQIRNLIFYNKRGYKFFSQKRDPKLSTGVMEDIFKENFFNNINFDEEEIEFLLNKMFINVTILHPLDKRELSCSGKANDYELK